MEGAGGGGGGVEDGRERESKGGREKACMSPTQAEQKRTSRSKVNPVTNIPKATPTP